MKILRSSSILAPLMLAVSMAAHAQSVAQLSDLFSNQLRQVAGTVEACSATQGTDEADWQFVAFMLDFTPYVSVGVPGLLQVQVSPEITFVWSDAD